ncbi:peptidoglycan/LPS O-acetylase OafA/YrhL [Caulobacter segnis]|nr:peptidoglycan/LPS O-acetylase OafA/YrhL [Caulobacter segnis]
MSGLLGATLRLGQEAVIVFFVLSGVVIFLNEYNRVSGLWAYCLRRLRRIYPPLIVSFFVSALVALDNGELFSKFSAANLLGNLASLQDIRGLKPGVWVDPFLGNSPLWSLSYEVAFYAIFPAVMIIWRRSPVLSSHVVGAISCLAYISYVAAPNHLSLVVAYFQVWWLGAMAVAQALKGYRTAASLKVELFWSFALCGLAAAAVAIAGYKGFGYYPFLQFRHFFLATVVVCALFGPAGLFLAAGAARWAGAWAFISSISYGLYIFHYPLVVQWKRAHSFAGLLFAGSMLLVCAWAFDRQLNRVLPKAPA